MTRGSREAKELGYLLGWDIVPSLRDFMKEKFGILGFLEITSTQIVAAQYIADFADDSHADDTIVRWSRPFNRGEPDHSHSEIGFWINGHLVFYSATSRPCLGGKGGTRWITAEELLKHPERWDIFCKESYTYSEIRDMILRADEECGKPYDWVGIAGFGSVLDLVGIRLWFRKKIKKLKTLATWYCSRIVQYVEIRKIIRMSPMRRHRWMKNNGWEQARYVHHQVFAIRYFK